MQTYFLFVIIPMILGFWAQSRIRSAYSKYSAVPTQYDMSGAQAARKMLDQAGLQNVQIERVEGTLTDHYDPTKRVLRLSQGVYDSASVASVGVACHEAGHAYQHAAAYPWLTLRSRIVPVVGIGSNLGILLFIGGLALSSLVGSFGITIAWIGIILFSLTTVFTLITLPVEFDASNRAKKWAANTGVFTAEEQKGIATVLDAAALTYIAAALQSIATLLYYSSILSGGNRRRRY